MYTLKTSDFFKINGIDRTLMNIDTLKDLADDSFISKFHCSYALFPFNYKIEFCFNKKQEIQYIMVEESGLDDSQKNSKITFIDDISIFCKKKGIILKEFNTDICSNDVVRIKNVELYFSEDKLDSLYFFITSQNKNNV